MPVELALETMISIELQKYGKNYLSTTSRRLSTYFIHEQRVLGKSTPIIKVLFGKQSRDESINVFVGVFIMGHRYNSCSSSP